MADFIRKVADHPPAGSSPGGQVVEGKNWGKYGSMRFDVTATGGDQRILSGAPDRLIKSTLKPDGRFEDGKGKASV